MKGIKRLASGVAAVILLISTAAHARPIYLVCVLDNDGDPMLWDLVLNEESSTVTRTVIRSGSEDTMRANFGEAEILFSYLIIPDSTFGINYRLNMQNGMLLSQAQGNVLSGQIGQWKEAATCKVWK